MAESDAHDGSFDSTGKGGWTQFPRRMRVYLMERYPTPQEALDALGTADGSRSFREWIAQLPPDVIREFLDGWGAKRAGGRCMLVRLTGLPDGGDGVYIMLETLLDKLDVHGVKLRDKPEVQIIA